MREAAARAAPLRGAIPEVQGELDWLAIHEALLGLAKRKASYDAEEAKWLRLGQRAAVHRKLGYGSFFEYVERVFGYTPKVAAERLRVAEALEALPETSRALADNALSWSAARELTRVATAETESDWLESRTAKLPSADLSNAFGAALLVGRLAPPSSLRAPCPETVVLRHPRSV